MRQCNLTGNTFCIWYCFDIAIQNRGSIDHQSWLIFSHVILFIILIIIIIILMIINSKIKHQSIPSTNIPPLRGDPRGFALYCCPGAGIYTWWPSQGGGFLHIHKITFSTVKKYTFTQLAFGSYLHALHRQFRLSILAWLNTKILK